jgi:hypothetical protein
MKQEQDRIPKYWKQERIWNWPDVQRIENEIMESIEKARMKQRMRSKRK